MEQHGSCPTVHTILVSNRWIPYRHRNVGDNETGMVSMMGIVLSSITTARLLLPDWH